MFYNTLFSHLATAEIVDLKKNSFCNYPSASSYFFSSLRLFFDDICTLPMRQRMRKEEHTKSLFLTINENEDD